MPEKHSIVIFGAGKIGRSFIGQLFGNAGYRVIFVDVDKRLVEALNDRGSYRVVVKGDREEVMEIGHVEAVYGLDRKLVVGAIYQADILAVSVGKNALEKIMPALAEGLEYRRRQGKMAPLDIILAENMRSASDFCRTKLQEHLPDDFPLDTTVGLIETSIGKMVPIMTQVDIDEDPLQVFAEPYNTLILDAKGFKGDIPDVSGLAPKENIQAWVDRKAFIHNMGHAAAAYCGHYHHPEARFMYEIMEDPAVWQFTRGAMLQAADVLLEVYDRDFTRSALVDHIDDLLHRFGNKALKDTVFRVGHDLPRKLGRDDRFMGVIRMAGAAGNDYSSILHAMVYGYFFDARDESGLPHPADSAFRNMLHENMEAALAQVSGIERPADDKILKNIRQMYAGLLAGYRPAMS